MNLLLAISMLALAFSAPSRLTIRVRGQILTCTVPRNPDNRYLILGIENYVAHGLPIDGDGAAVTFQASTQNLGCETGEVLTAFCALRWSPEGQAKVTAPLLCIK